MPAPSISALVACAERTLPQIRERRDALRAEAEQILIRSDEHLSEEDTTRFDAIEKELDALAKREAMFVSMARMPASAEAAIEGYDRIGGRRSSRTAPEPSDQARRIVEDAHTRGAIDDAGAERADRMVEAGSPLLHQLVEATGGRDYERAFRKILADPLQGIADFTDPERQAWSNARAHARAMGEGSIAAGSALVPFYLDPSIVLTNVGSVNPFRGISRVETITTNAWHGVTSAGMTAGYLGEGSEVADGSPDDFAQPTVPVYKAAAYLQASFEVTEDTNIASQVGLLIADARANFEAHEFAVGTGSGSSHIEGVVTGVAAVSGSVVDTAAADTFTVGDVYALLEALPDRWQPNASWVSAKSIQALIRQFATGTGQNVGAFWTTLGGGNPSELIGNPIRQASAMDSTVADNKNILLVGDFARGYLIVDRIGMTIQFNPLVVGADGRPTGEVGWFAHWRTGGKVLVPDAFRLLKVTPAA